MKILLPVDGSDYTKRMLAYITTHDELLSADNEFLVVTAVPPVPAHASRFLDRKVVDEYYADQAEEVLRPVRELVEQKRWNARFSHVVGHAADAIAQYAVAQGAQLIVMGTHGRSALGNMALGSVSSGVLARCNLPVLLIR